MALSYDLISKFVRATNDKTKDTSGSTLYGTAKVDSSSTAVQLDGSDGSPLVPVTTSTNVRDGDRVIVTIKDHKASIVGNITSPSATVKDNQETGDKIVDAYALIADKASIGDLNTEKARIDDLYTDNASIRETLTAAEADIDTLQADNVTITETITTNSADIKTLKSTTVTSDFLVANYATIENLEATNTTVHNLESAYAEFETTTTNRLDAVDATITDLVYHETKFLWGDDLSSGMYMTEEHTVNLKESVSSQRHGIVLVFCAYNGTEDTNDGWQSFFVPKELVAVSTSGHTFVLGCGKFTYMGTKYLYIGNTSITGHADNILTGTNNGITYANNKFVLRYVIGI